MSASQCVPSASRTRCSVRVPRLYWDADAHTPKDTGRRGRGRNPNHVVGKVTNP